VIPTETKGVIPDFKDKTIYAPYVSFRSQILHIATNKGYQKTMHKLYNIHNIKEITFKSKQRHM